MNPSLSHVSNRPSLLLLHPLLKIYVFANHAVISPSKLSKQVCARKILIYLLYILFCTAYKKPMTIVAVTVTCSCLSTRETRPFCNESFCVVGMGGKINYYLEQWGKYHCMCNTVLCVPYCTVMYCTVFYCKVVYCTAQYSIALN